MLGCMRYCVVRRLTGRPPSWRRSNKLRPNAVPEPINYAPQHNIEVSNITFITTTHKTGRFSANQTTCIDECVAWEIIHTQKSAGLDLQAKGSWLPLNLTGLKGTFWAGRCHTEGLLLKNLQLNETTVALSKLSPFITCTIPIGA